MRKGLEILAASIEARSTLLRAEGEGAYRLFNGFFEGLPELAVDLYGRTIVLHNYAEPPASANDLLQAVQELLLHHLPYIRSVWRKDRFAPDEAMRRGHVIWGGAPDRQVREHGVVYAIYLALNQDASLYLDTRRLRRWALDHLGGKRVLNTFAYSGSLGVAALAGGAARVVQLDRNRSFLDLAKRSYALNGFPVRQEDFLVGDFFTYTARLRRSGELFDCVFLDPPLFSAGPRSSVDLLRGSERLINKVRPLIANGGWLVAINNALFLEGAAFLRLLENLGADGYLAIESLVPVPEDVTGYPQTRVGAPPASPDPFNHPTKIAILRVQRKELP